VPPPSVYQFPGLIILRFDDGLFFVNADALADRLRGIRVEVADDSLTGVVLSMEGVDFIDTEGADTIRKIAEACRDQNIDFHLARVKPDVLDVLERDGAIDSIGTLPHPRQIAAAVDEHERRQPAT
jgi:anti-anti-sigma factor